MDVGRAPLRGRFGTGCCKVVVQKKAKQWIGYFSHSPPAPNLPERPDAAPSLKIACTAAPVLYKSALELKCVVCISCCSCNPYPFNSRKNIEAAWSWNSSAPPTDEKRLLPIVRDCPCSAQTAESVTNVGQWPLLRTDCRVTHLRGSVAVAPLPYCPCLLVLVSCKLKPKHHNTAWPAYIYTYIYIYIYIYMCMRVSVRRLHVLELMATLTLFAFDVVIALCMLLQ